MTIEDILIPLELGLFCRRKSEPEYYYFVYDGKNYNRQVGLAPEGGRPELGKGYKISAYPVLLDGYNGYSLEDWEPSVLDALQIDWEVPAIDMVLPDAPVETQVEEKKQLKRLDVSKPILKRPERQVEPDSGIDFDTSLIHIKHGGIIEEPIYGDGDVLAKQYYLFNLQTLMTRDRLYDKKYTPWVAYTWVDSDFTCMNYRLLAAKDRNDT